MIIQMVYQSNLARPLGPLNLLAIQKAAIRENTAATVTSFLYHDAARVFQVIEGPRLGVDQTLQRIAQSDLHSDITTRAVMRTNYRSFPNWAFGAAQSKDPVFRQIHSTFANPDFFDLNVLDAIKMLKMVAIRKRRALLRDESRFFGDRPENRTPLRLQAVGE